MEEIAELKRGGEGEILKKSANGCSGEPARLKSWWALESRMGGERGVVGGGRHGLSGVRVGVGGGRGGVTGGRVGEDVWRGDWC